MKVHGIFLFAGSSLFCFQRYLPLCRPQIVAQRFSSKVAMTGSPIQDSLFETFALKPFLNIFLKSILRANEQLQCSAVPYSTHLTHIFPLCSLSHNLDCSLLQKNFGKLIFAHQLDGISDTQNSTDILSVNFPFQKLHIREKMEEHLCSSARRPAEGCCSAKSHLIERTGFLGGIAPGTSQTASLLCETGLQPMLHDELFISVLMLQNCSPSTAKVAGL